MPTGLKVDGPNKRPTPRAAEGAHAGSSSSTNIGTPSCYRTGVSQDALIPPVWQLPPVTDETELIEIASAHEEDPPAYLPPELWRMLLPAAEITALPLLIPPSPTTHLSFPSETGVLVGAPTIRSFTDCSAESLSTLLALPSPSFARLCSPSGVIVALWLHYCYDSTAVTGKLQSSCWEAVVLLSAVPFVRLDHVYS